MSTTYGTIPTTPPPSDPPFLVHARQRVRSDMGTRRPWKEMVSFSLPESFNAALQRIQTNTSYFHVNYAMIILFALFINLLWHPVALIVFVAMTAAWLFLYILRDEPVVLFGYAMEEQVVLVVLSILTVVTLMMTRASVFVAGLVVGVVVVVAHGAFRRTNDLVLDEEDGGGHGGDRVVDLKETASASYSSSNS
ncbi:PRA1 family protein F2-like [Sesamum indicum]|uniref:PRA1 family protein n=1 Tax=Sesamum indicum TaxID=4182 RepID=A0A6I9T5A5_SESIN|nr:PRA1 family protein F2-like [Sesamum indicum]